MFVFVIVFITIYLIIDTLNRLDYTQPPQQQELEELLCTEDEITELTATAPPISEESKQDTCVVYPVLRQF